MHWSSRYRIYMYCSISAFIFMPARIFYTGICFIASHFPCHRTILLGMMGGRVKKGGVLLYGFPPPRGSFFVSLPWCLWSRCLLTHYNVLPMGNFTWESRLIFLEEVLVLECAGWGAAPLPPSTNSHRCCTRRLHSYFHQHQQISPRTRRDGCGSSFSYLCNVDGENIRSLIYSPEFHITFCALAVCEVTQGSRFLHEVFSPSSASSLASLKPFFSHTYFLISSSLCLFDDLV